MAANQGSPADRNAWIERIVETYQSYEAAGGRKGRWTGREPGSRIAQAERDQWLMTALAPSAGGRVVDLGCGDGNVARTIAAQGIAPAEYLGMDLIAQRIDAARAATPWASFVVGSADDVPVADAWADAVVAMTLFSSILEDRFRTAVVSEIRRILRPGGRAVIYDMRIPSPSNPHVAPLTAREVAAHFPGWKAQIESLTLLPPLARLPIAGGARRYRLLRALPILRSHIGAVLVKP